MQLSWDVTYGNVDHVNRQRYGGREAFTIGHVVEHPLLYTRMVPHLFMDGSLAFPGKC